MFPRSLAVSTLLLSVLCIAPPARAEFAQWGGKLVGTGPVGTSIQGNGVALSGDGLIAAVGGPNDNTNVGATWFYFRIGGLWSQPGSKVFGAGATGAANQGWSVAISADGNTAVTGGTGDNAGVGAIWPYTRLGLNWNPQGAKLVGMGGVGASRQGYSVALSSDGNTAIEGAYGDASSAGAAWVFTRTGSTWSQQGAKLVGSGAVAPSDRGYSVALSADGNTALVGGPVDNLGAGAAWVFTRSASVWSQQGAKLVGTGASSAASQGIAVALSADGNTAFVGGCNDNSGVGAVWVFTRSAGVWSQQGAKLVGSDVAGASRLGISVAASADGNVVFVGGYQDNAGAGALWEFNRVAGTWSQRGPKRTAIGAVGIANLGASVAISADAQSALAGGPGDNTNVGAAWAFVNASPAIESARDVPNDQGGMLNLRWTASAFDGGPASSIDAYWIWRQVPNHSTATAARRARDASLRTTIQSGQVYYWEYVGSQVAHGFPAYSYSASTLSDSVPGSNPYTLFMVEAERTSTGDHWGSAPDSGYSVDNLPPGPPAPVTAAYAGGATHLHWGVNPESDFALYRVYRGGSAGFVPGPGNLITTQPDTGFADVGASGNYYKLSAVDAHGNESVFALVTPGSTTGVDGGPAPGFALEGVSPNPARGRGLVVAFALPTGATARLDLLDTSGRDVLAREVGSMGPGRHTLDLAPGRRIAPGLYWVRLVQGANRGLARVAVIE